MNKPFLVIGNDYYYPSADTDDWLGCFETKELAEQFIEDLRNVDRCTVQYQYLKEVYNLSKFVHVYPRDAYTIVDLRDWIE